MLGAEDVAIFIRAQVQVHELGVVTFLELEIAGVLVAVEGLVVSAFADDDRFLAVRREKIEDGADGVDVGDGNRVVGQHDVGLEQDPLVPDGAQDVVLEGLEGPGNVLVPVLPFDKADPRRRGDLGKELGGGMGLRKSIKKTGGATGRAAAQREASQSPESHLHETAPAEGVFPHPSSLNWGHHINFRILCARRMRG